MGQIKANIKSEFLINENEKYAWVFRCVRFANIPGQTRQDVREWNYVAFNKKDKDRFENNFKAANVHETYMIHDGDLQRKIEKEAAEAKEREIREAEEEARIEKERKEREALIEANKAEEAARKAKEQEAVKKKKIKQQADNIEKEVKRGRPAKKGGE